MAREKREFWLKSLVNNSNVLNFLLKFNLDLLKSEDILIVSKLCDFRCLFCNVWKKPLQEVDEYSNFLVSLVRKNTFFNHFKRRKQYHLCGGDPFQNPYLPEIISYLFKRKINIFLWTHGTAHLDVLDELIEKVSCFYLYLPSTLKENYREMTGSDTLDVLKDTMHNIKLKGGTYILNFYIRPDNIDEIPDVYEFAYQSQCKLILHYSISDHYTGDSIKFIKRYRKVNQVEVYSNLKPFNSCLALPLPGSISFFQKMITLYYKIWNQVRIFLGIY